MRHLHDGPMTGRTVLVTGATSGIGLATALGLATQGAHAARLWEASADLVGLTAAPRA